ncbi:MAG: glycosyltransferase family protein [Magnetococcales bacterium]|nr:glycosyltransferase family protein [Magnetococcales bacterium]
MNDPQKPTPQKPHSQGETTPEKPSAQANWLITEAIDHYNHNRLSQAGKCASLALKHHPDTPAAYHVLGLIAQKSDKLELAARLMEKAVAGNPGNPQFLFHLGNVEMARQRYQKAEQLFKAALHQKPDFAQAVINLGNIRFTLDDHPGAVAHYQTALELDPRQSTPYYNLGVIAQEYGQHREAVRFFDSAITLAPNFAPAHTGKSFSHLIQEEFAPGWREYEWRFHLERHAPRICPVPRWDGTPLNGKRLYVYTEQGFGDALMFARFLPLVEALGGRIFLECKPQLLSLFEHSGLAEKVTPRDTEDTAPPPFDYDLHIPLMSLPEVLGTTLENLPATIPYLTPNPEVVAKWRNKLAAIPGLKVGLSWSGNPQASVNRHRACTLMDLKPLLAVPNVTFFSIQKGEPAQQLRNLQEPHAIHDLDRELTDFSETAGLLKNLDLLISTDTAVVHLAGAIGATTWTLLHTASEWRWLEDRPGSPWRTKSPWYPGMRLFRQESPQVWSSAVNRAAQALRNLESGQS